MAPPKATLLLLAGLLSSATAAVVEAIPTPAVNETARSSTMSFSYSSFTYAPMPSARYATPLASPMSFATPYAPAFSQVSTLLDANITYTTYSLNPAATSTNDGLYGQSAYAALWKSVGWSYHSTPPYTTTVSPTPVATSELVYPPALVVEPMDKHVTVNMTLPCDFVWGLASSAVQVEGGLQLDGRGPSIEDGIGALPSNRSDFNVDAMFYYYYKQDMKRLGAIGIPYFCFSIPWTRVVPFGYAGSPVNTAALDHYDDLINEALANGVTPIITILHYDYPVNIPYSNPNFTEHYLYYAKQIMTRYGDRVPHWVSVNEPNLQPVNNALTNVLEAHAALYDWYKNELNGTGQITMKFANNLAIPLNTSNPEDVRASLRYQDFSLGIMNNPMFLGEQIPAEVLNTTGIQISPLTDAQIAAFKGRIDYFAFDPYSSQYVGAPPGGIDACAADSSNPLWPTCVVTTNDAANGWLIGDESAVAYSFISTQYVRSQFNYVWNTLKPSGILVSEYGFPIYGDYLKPLDAQRYDMEKTIYYQNFLTELLRAVNEDGVNVIGALGWAFVETNEFGTFDDHYGLQTLNHTDFSRMYKRSIFDYVDWFHAHVPSS